MASNVQTTTHTASVSAGKTVKAKSHVSTRKSLAPFVGLFELSEEARQRRMHHYDRAPLRAALGEMAATREERRRRAT
jgi:hypothetical protein